MKKKILMLLTNAFDPDPRVHQEAVALVDAGYHVTILCWDRDRKAKFRETIDGISTERVYVRSTHGRGATQMLFLALFWIKALLKGLYRDYDIVHCHDFDTLLPGFFLAKAKGAKLVYDSHESYVDMLWHLPAWIRGIISATENVLLKRTDLLITVGEKLETHLSERGAPRTCVVGNWKDPSKFEFPENRILEEKKSLSITDSQKVICFIANLGHERQVPQLIEAAKQNAGIFLVMGGNGPARDLVEAAADLYPNIHFLGYVHPSKVPLFTALSDIVFYGFDPENPNARFSAPNKLFEALAAGKAVITGDFGEIAKIVKETGCGIVLERYSEREIGDAIQSLSDGDLDACKARSREASRERYCWDMARKTLLLEYGRLGNV